MDLNTLEYIHANMHGQGWITHIMKVITYFAEFGLGPLICGLILLVIKPTRKCGFATCIGLAASVLIVNIILKHCVNRARPWTELEELVDFYDKYNIRRPTDSSFPSGHSSLCFCVAIVLMLHYKLKGLPALIFAVLVAFTRIYLCLHYPTDVIAGAAIGSACGVGGYFAGKYLYPVAERLIIKLFKKDNASPEDGVEEAVEEKPEKNDEKIIDGE